MGPRSPQQRESRGATGVSPTPGYCTTVSPAGRFDRDAVVPIEAVDDRRAVPWPALVLAVALFALAYANGGYGIGARSVAAIVLWWIVFLAVALGLAPSARVPRIAPVAAMLFAAFAAWSALSATWAPSAELAVLEFDRNALYLGVFLVALGLGRRRTLHWWLDGLRLALAAVAIVALASRLFPGLFPDREIGAFLPNAATRLSFPLGYWNALAVFVALAVPLHLAAALAARTPARRAVAVAGVPPVAAVVVLASSRGGVLAASVGTVVFIAATDRRWAAVATSVVAGVGSVAAVLVLYVPPRLVDGPPATGRGFVLAVALVLACAGTAGALLTGERLLAGRRSPSRRVGVALLAVASTAVVIAVVAADPVARFDGFRRPPTENQSAPNFATAHLTSGGSSGRWQFWAAAIDEWRSAPLVGEGAGAYRFWWSEHASFTYTLRNAHSLYLEVLGELGVVGLLLLLGALGCGVVGGIRATRASVGAQRRAIAGLLGAYVAFLVSAGIDWLWQVTAVGAVGMIGLALLVAAGDWPERERVGIRGSRARLAFVGVCLLGSWVAICAAVVPWLTAERVDASAAAARRGDLGAALSAARDAHAIQPWAASPVVQIALVLEARGDYAGAASWVRRAVEKDEKNWATWYVASRIERQAGNRAAAAAAYRRARSLNVRSPLFAGKSR